MKKTTRLLLIILTGLFATFSQSLKAQDSTKTKKDLKNTIHFNLTNPFIFGEKSLIFGYERVLNKRQSFTINIGHATFPSLNLINTDSLKVNRNVGQKGFHISADFRFYLAKENKYGAPRGVYIGPYYSYNFFEKTNTWTLTNNIGITGDVTTQLSMNIHTVGAELGYQFVLWRRLAIDLILLGPGVSSYSLKANIKENISADDKEELLERINDALIDKFPGYSAIISEEGFERRGTVKTTSLGFRYMIQLGFRF